MDPQTPEIVAAPAVAPESLPAFTPLPPETPAWLRWLVANWGAIKTRVNAELRDVVPFLVAAGAEVYAQYGDQIVASIPSQYRPHIVAAAGIALIVWRRLRNRKSKGQQ